MRIDFKWTPEKKDEVIKRLEAWIIKYGATAGEVICQDDNCLIEAPYLIADLVDTVIQPEVTYDDED